MSKMRLLFVLFSLIVLAAPGRAQEREHGHGKPRGDAEHKRERDRGEKRAERDDDDEDDDDDGRFENRNRNDRDDDEDDDEDEDDEGDDDRRVGRRTSCIDANGNNVCDVLSNGRMPSTLPEMVNAVLISRGQLTRSGRSWLGGRTFTPRFTSSASNPPRQVTWLDRRGAVSQVWLDNNRDGRADVVRLYRKGKLVRTVRR